MVLIRGDHQLCELTSNLPLTSKDLFRGRSCDSRIHMLRYLSKAPRNDKVRAGRYRTWERLTLSGRQLGLRWSYPLLIRELS